MKRMTLLLIAVALALALASCEMAGGPTAEEELSEEAVAQAAADAMEVANLAMVARSSGDYAALNAYLAANDPDGEVLATLEKHGVFASRPVPKGVTNLPPFEGGPYMNGDVLVCKGSGSATSALMEMILVRGYGHAGILNKTLADAGAPCVLSADVDYLTAFDPAKFALTYETYEGWRDGNDTVTVLRKGEEEPNLGKQITTEPFDAVFYGYNVGSVYAFFGYAGIEYGAFQPIPRVDNKYWYCSKTAWRVLNEPSAGGIDAEQEDFYFTDGKWKVFKDSLLYDLLRVYLYSKSPFAVWKWWKWIELEKTATTMLVDALEELIAPDELRAWDGFGYHHAYGDASYDATVWSGFSGY